MNSVNVLILSAGHRVFLVQAFREAQRIRENSGLVIAADAEKLSPSLAAADIGLVSPKTYDKDFNKWVNEIATRYAPLLLLTNYERDLFILEPMRSSLRKRQCKLIGMPINSLEICLDKHKTAILCKKIGLQTPLYWTVEEVSNIAPKNFPLIAKEKYGRGSRGQYVINSPKELDLFLESNTSSIMLQQMVSGIEYGIDIVNDLNGKFAVVFARQKLLMRDGETSIAEIVEPQPFFEIAQLLSSHLAHQGCVDVDLIVSGSNMYILDINPRFGGGYPFSHFAGANLPATFLAWASEDLVDNTYFKPSIGQISAKISSMHLISE